MMDGRSHPQPWRPEEGAGSALPCTEGPSCQHREFHCADKDGETQGRGGSPQALWDGVDLSKVCLTPSLVSVTFRSWCFKTHS